MLIYMIIIMNLLKKYKLFNHQVIRKIVPALKGELRSGVGYAYRLDIYPGCWYIKNYCTHTAANQQSINAYEKTARQE